MAGLSPAARWHMAAEAVRANGSVHRQTKDGAVGSETDTEVAPDLCACAPPPRRRHNEGTFLRLSFPI